MPTESTAPTADQPLRVVVAEDETLIRLDIVEILSAEGYAVVGEADNGQRAVELATELAPDVVLMDVKMPIMDGITAAEQIAREIKTEDWALFLRVLEETTAFADAVDLLRGPPRTPDSRPPTPPPAESPC